MCVCAGLTLARNAGTRLRLWVYDLLLQFQFTFFLKAFILAFLISCIACAGIGCLIEVRSVDRKMSC